LYAAASLESLQPVRTIELKTTLHHVQGMAVDGDRLWVTSVDARAKKGWLHEFSQASGEAIRAIEIQDGPRFHPGGISTEKDSLWIPIAEYRAHSTAIIERRSRQTLELESRFSVGDHIGCVAAGQDVLIGGNWDSRELYVWDRSGKLLRRVPNPTANAFQDMKFDSGELVGSGLLWQGRIGAIDWLEFPTLRPLRRLTAGRTSRGAAYTREGMAIRDGLLYLMPEDGPSRVFVFRFAK
jgi:hypothetical protein